MTLDQLIREFVDDSQYQELGWKFVDWSSGTLEMAKLSKCPSGQTPYAPIVLFNLYGCYLYVQICSRPGWRWTQEVINMADQGSLEILKSLIARLGAMFKVANHDSA